MTKDISIVEGQTLILNEFELIFLNERDWYGKETKRNLTIAGWLTNGVFYLMDAIDEKKYSYGARACIGMSKRLNNIFNSTNTIKENK